jgi:hyperosmotically inducible periplasmic protein
MKRRSAFIFGASALVGTLSFVPCVLAQTNAPPDTRSGSTLKDKTNDTAVTAKVQAALAEDKDTSGAADAIHVQTTGGIVTLTGDVTAQAIAEHAQLVVARLPGVRDVVNDLKYPHSQAASGVNSGPIVVPPASPASSTS